jgi:hypothetical protein
VVRRRKKKGINQMKISIYLFGRPTFENEPEATAFSVAMVERELPKGGDIDKPNNSRAIGDYLKKSNSSEATKLDPFEVYGEFGDWTSVRGRYVSDTPLQEVSGVDEDDAGRSHVFLT